MKKRYTRRSNSRPQNEEMSLNITALADVFVILLVFMLKSFSSGLQIMPNQPMTLPQAGHSDAGDISAMKVEITNNAILVESEKAEDLSVQSSPAGEYPGLRKALNKAKEKQRYLASQGAGVAKPNELVVLADKDVPYWVIKKALVSAAMEGMTDAKLAVVKE